MQSFSYSNQCYDILTHGCTSSFEEGQIVTNKKKSRNKFNKFKTIDIIELVKEAIKLHDDYMKKCDHIEHNIDQLSEDAFKSFILDIQNDKAKLQDQISYLNENVERFKKKIDFIRRKREAKKRRRINDKNYKLYLETSYKEKEKEIDELIAAKKEDQSRRQERNEMKKDAEIVLNRVKNKYFQAKQYQEKILALEKARKALKESSERRSLFVTKQCDDEFFTQIQKVKSFVEKQIMIYAKEQENVESLLKNRLNKVDEEENNECQQKLYDQIMNEQAKIAKALFGDDPYPNLSDVDSYYNWQYYEQAHHNMQNMLRIRTQWDQYLDFSNGTKVHQHYIIPPSPSSVQWEKYLQTK